MTDNTLILIAVTAITMAFGLILAINLAMIQKRVGKLTSEQIATFVFLMGGTRGRVGRLWAGVGNFTEAQIDALVRFQWYCVLELMIVAVVVFSVTVFVAQR